MAAFQLGTIFDTIKIKAITMKAIDIIDAMTRDSEVAESSLLWPFDEDDSVKEWANRIFGRYHVKDGELKPGTYLAIFQFDGIGLHAQEWDIARRAVTLVRDDPDEGEEDDQEIYLWRVEE